MSGREYFVSPIPEHRAEDSDAVMIHHHDSKQQGMECTEWQQISAEHVRMTQGPY